MPEIDIEKEYTALKEGDGCPLKALMDATIPEKHQTILEELSDHEPDLKYPLLFMLSIKPTNPDLPIPTVVIIGRQGNPIIPLYVERTLNGRILQNHCWAEAT